MSDHFYFDTDEICFSHKANYYTGMFNYYQGLSAEDGWRDEWVLEVPDMAFAPSFRPLSTQATP